MPRSPRLLRECRPSKTPRGKAWSGRAVEAQKGFQNLSTCEPLLKIPKKLKVLRANQKNTKELGFYKSSIRLLPGLDRSTRVEVLREV